MKSKQMTLMVLSIGFGLIAAIGISQVMGRSSTAQPAIEMGPVLVAADHLDIYSKLTEENVKIENWPANIIPENAATSLEDIKDTIVLSRLSKGMPIVDSQMVNEKEHINNRLTIPATSKTFLKALRVWSVDGSLRANREEGGNGSGSAIVGVLVNEKQSEDIYFAQKTGQIKLVLRGDYVEGDDDVDDLSELLNWDNEQEAGALADDLVDTPASSRGSSTRGQSGQRMIIWERGSAREITFASPNSLPMEGGGGSEDEFDDEIGAEEEAVRFE